MKPGTFHLESWGHWEWGTDRLLGSGKAEEMFWRQLGRKIDTDSNDQVIIQCEEGISSLAYFGLQFQSQQGGAYYP